MKKQQSVASWWASVQREGFAEYCISRFGTNFDNAPTFIVRSEFIKTKGSETHTLYKQIHHGLEPLSAGRKVARQGKQAAAKMSADAMRMGASLLGVLALMLFAAPASAGPISGCVDSLPAAFSFSSSNHLQVAVWEDVPGCNPSSPQARPTGGPYWMSCGEINTVTFSGAGFNPFCSSQADVREVLADGSYIFHDFTYNPPTANAALCFPSTPAPVPYAPTPSDGGWVPPAGGGPVGGGDTGVSPSPLPPSVNPLMPPVTVPDAGSTFLLMVMSFAMGMGVLMAWGVVKASDDEDIR
jgi:hypothetical protein